MNGLEDLGIDSWRKCITTASPMERTPPPNGRDGKCARTQEQSPVIQSLKMCTGTRDRLLERVQRLISRPALLIRP